MAKIKDKMLVHFMDQQQQSEDRCAKTWSRLKRAWNAHAKAERRLASARRRRQRREQELESAKLSQQVG